MLDTLMCAVVSNEREISIRASKIFCSLLEFQNSAQIKVSIFYLAIHLCFFKHLYIYIFIYSNNFLPILSFEKLIFFAYILNSNFQHISLQNKKKTVHTYTQH